MGREQGRALEGGCAGGPLRLHARPGGMTLCSGFEGFGLAPMFTQRATCGQVEIVEETEASLSFGLRAAMAGVGFMPSTAWLGTDLPHVRPDVKVVRDPYSEREYTAFPALSADVAVIHALEADRLGNTRIGGNPALDRELAMVAGQVVITAERIVDTLSGLLDLPGIRDDAVVEAPRGAWPTSCHPSYPVGVAELLDYIDACAAGDFAGYLRRVQVGLAGP